jgi:predicted amidohydrolase YtcJ
MPAMSNPSIDLILTNGKIWTGHDSPAEVEALAISGSTVAAIGTSSQMLRLRSTRTEVIDLKGRRVTPGFNDAHLHFYLGGRFLSSVQLRDARDEREFRRRIESFARSRPEGEWILGGSWDPEGWASGKLPSCGLIDPVTPHHPVCVTRLDGHTALANSLAMRLAGVDRNTPDVPGGVIFRDAAGNPTGIFQDAAKALVERVIPAPSHPQITDAVRAAQQYAARHGVTSVQDMGLIGTYDLWPEVLRVYQGLLRRGELQTRISAHHPLAKWRELLEIRAAGSADPRKLRIAALKGFADGSLGSATAWFFEPYTDAPDTCGIRSDEMQDPEQMYRNIRGADEFSVPVAIHAIGDRANRAILDLFERLTREMGARDRRPRIEHAQHLHPTDIPRFAGLGVIASMQPYHSIDDARWAEKRIGAERARTAYAFRSLIDSGAVLAFGSDWFVEPIEPILGIYGAVTRESVDGQYQGAWIPEQRISVAEAVQAYTMGSAYASFEENIKGSLEPGKLADAVVLSDDIFSCDPADIRHAQVDMTIFDGLPIYER